MNDHTATDTPPELPAVGARLEPEVGRPVPERAGLASLRCDGCGKTMAEHDKLARCPPRSDIERAIESGWLEHGWRPMWEAPKCEGPLLLLVPTRFAHRATHIQVQGEWLGSYWVIFNADEAVQRVEPDGWRRLHAHPASKTPNVGGEPQTPATQK